MRHAYLTVALAALAPVTFMPAARADLNVLLPDLKLVPLSGIEASVVEPAGEAKPAPLSFDKAGDERRLLALEGVPQSSLEGARALDLSYRVQMEAGQAPRLALVIFEGDGGCWYRLSAGPVQLDRLARARLSLASLRQAAFSTDASGALEWANVAKVWVGLIIDGPAEGSLELLQARFTDEPYRPESPLRVTGDGPGEWHAGQDRAVKSELTTPNEGPGGAPCMKYEFTVPGGRHMYAIPSTGIVPAELEGYTALRFKYRANIPPGMRLLVTLTEREGAQYYVEPPGPWAAEWAEMTIPLSRFKAASWGARDTNDTLDLPDLKSVTIGTHGTPAEGGAGLVMVADVELVP
jgi:hypothetical protein